jgi:HSP20 family protein
MSEIIRWEPIREMRRLQNMFDRMFNEPLLTRASAEDVCECYAPVDVYETDNEILVEAVMPGVKADDIQISITGDVLRIRGEMSDGQVETKDGARYLLRELQIGSYSRSLRLPMEVDPKKAVAEMENGILKLTLPKAEEAKPKTINIKAK